MSKKVCSVEGCNKIAKSRGLCDAHYKSKQKSGELKTATYEKRKGAVCSVEGCNRPVYSRELCILHYQRYMKHGTTSEEALSHKTCSMSLEERLRFYSQEVDENDCFVWQGTINNDGYGVVYWHNYPYRAHRISYWLYNGEIPEGKVVCHRCNNKLCVNPDHLYAATPKKNTQDAVRDGLMVGKTGENSASAKLTRDQAVEVVKRRKQGERKIDIAKDYGISHWTFGDILKGTSWPDIDRDSIEETAKRNIDGNIIPNYKELQPARGEKHPNAKLTDKQVRQIKYDVFKRGIEQVKLAERFGVGREVISDIIRDKAWTHIQTPDNHPRERRRS